MEPTTGFQLAEAQTYWTAVAAVAAVLIGCLTVTVNAVGLYLLWGQLRANREALAAATKSANAATEAARHSQLTSRPWIKFDIDGGLLRLMPELPDEMTAMVSVNYENIGQTPAIQVAVIFKPLIVVRDVEPDIAREFAALLATRPPFLAETLFSGDKKCFGANLRIALSVTARR